MSTTKNLHIRRGHRSLVMIDEHFSGPTGWGHGGVTAGRLAELVEPDGASVRFVAPIPLGQPLRAQWRTDRLEVLARGRPVAEVRDLERELSAPVFEMPSARAIDDAERAYLEPRAGVHPAPTCFACGSDRSHGGLQLRPGPVGSSGDFATRWTPGGSGLVPSWLVWAAIDCPTGFPALPSTPQDHIVVTGELTAQIRRRLRSDETYVILSRRTGGSGPRHVTEAAITTSAGEVVAIANAIWFSVPAAGFGAPSTAKSCA